MKLSDAMLTELQALACLLRCDADRSPCGRRLYNEVIRPSGARYVSHTLTHGGTTVALESRRMIECTITADLRTVSRPTARGNAQVKPCHRADCPLRGSEG